MAGVAEVVAFERNDNGDVVRYDKGGDEGGTAEHFSDPGDDGVPLAGDSVVLIEGEGAGEENAGGYDDKTEKKAQPGEKRIYARSPAGVLVGEIWLKGDGTLVLKSVAASSGGQIEMKPDGSIELNGLKVDAQGNLETTGTIKGSEVSNNTISLGTHIHPTSSPGAPTGPGQGPPPAP